MDGSAHEPEVINNNFLFVPLPSPTLYLVYVYIWECGCSAAAAIRNSGNPWQTIQLQLLQYSLWLRWELFYFSTGEHNKDEYNFIHVGTYIVILICSIIELTTLVKPNELEQLEAISGVAEEWRKIDGL